MKTDETDFEYFYLELPQADDLTDIEIQDESEDYNYDDIQGLSEEQVSKLADDSLDTAPGQNFKSVSSDIPAPNQGTS